MKFQENPSSESRSVPYGHTDGNSADNSDVILTVHRR